MHGLREDVVPWLPRFCMPGLWVQLEKMSEKYCKDKGSTGFLTVGAITECLFKYSLDE